LLANTATLDDDGPSGGYEEDEDWRRALLEAIDCLAKEYGHEICRWDVMDYPYNPLTFPIGVTGGMSWGDPPTDAYEHFNNLGQCAPIMDLLLKWAREDMEDAELNRKPRHAF
jgi:hypothetical protein